MKPPHSAFTKHRLFWERANSSPLIGFSPGSPFISMRYRAAHPLLSDTVPLNPGHIDPGSFDADYLRHWEERMQAGDESCLCATPFPGLPWMEAICGCTVRSGSSGFTAHGPDIDSVSSLHLREPVSFEWYNLFLQWTDHLVSLSSGRFGVGQPILRGPADVIGTLLGQERFVYALLEEPAQIQRLLREVTGLFIDVTAKQRTGIPRWYGGSVMGMYDLWCPGDSIWFQDDLLSLLSPVLYEKHLLPLHRRIAEQAAYSLFHLHPVSFYAVDALLSIDGLKAIEVNRDDGGLSAVEMLPVLRKIAGKRNLVVWGTLSPDEVALLYRELPPRGVYIIVVADPDHRPDYHAFLADSPASGANLGS